MSDKKHTIIWLALVTAVVLVASMLIGMIGREAGINSKKCIHCKGTINKEAEKCNRCLEWQIERR